MSRILLAGGTGYLGSFLADRLHEGPHELRALARSPQKLLDRGLTSDEVVEAQVTDPATLVGCCEGVDAVISTVGITRQKDGLRYLDVDYQANVNLLEEAERAGVGRFVYVGVLGGEELRRLKICEAKERFVDRLRTSSVDSCVVRPTGFFSDMGEFLEMARRGRVYVFGDGDQRINPIHGADLAEVCVDAVASADDTIEVGGPEVLTYRRIADLAFAALGKPAKVTGIPDWTRRLVLRGLQLLTPATVHGPLEFFLTAGARDLVAPTHGTRTLAEHFAAASSEPRG